MGKTNFLTVVPATEKRTVSAPRRKPNAEYRSREHLTEGEVERLIAAAKDNRYGHRDATAILIAFRHGLRVSELVSLRWDQIDFQSAVLHVTRAKNGTPATHPLKGNELRALRKLKRESESKSPYVFISERGAPLTVSAFQKLINRVGKAAGFEFQLHAHMLRHACGYALANKGVDTRSLQAYLGHRQIQNTVRYTALAPHRFRDFWKD